LRDGQGTPISVARAGEDLEVVLHFERHAAGAFPRVVAEITVSTNLGSAVFRQGNWLAGNHFGDLPDRGAFVCRVPRLPLPVGQFRIGFRIAAEVRGRINPFDAIAAAADLHVEAGDFFGTGKLPPLKAGVCLVEGTWRLESAPATALVP
jgi:lipopolysaccharide transport system ATP-binding protein